MGVGIIHSLRAQTEQKAKDESPTPHPASLPVSPPPPSSCSPPFPFPFPSFEAGSPFSLPLNSRTPGSLAFTLHDLHHCLLSSPGSQACPSSLASGWHTMDFSATITLGTNFVRNLLLHIFNFFCFSGEHWQIQNGSLVQNQRLHIWRQNAVSIHPLLSQPNNQWPPCALGSCIYLRYSSEHPCAAHLATRLPWPPHGGILFGQQ